MDRTIGKRVISVCVSIANALIKSLLCIPKGTCRFYPSCTEYAHEAVEKLPVFTAILKISWRILRCNPLCRGGYDPAIPTIRKVEES